MDSKLLCEMNNAKRLMLYTGGVQKPTNEKILKEELIKEGFKDWLLGASLLVSAFLMPGKLDAQVNKIPKAELKQTIESINSFLNDDVRINQMTKFLREKGYKGDIISNIAKRGEFVINKIEDNMKNVVGVDVVQTSDWTQLLRLLNSGQYAITKANITTVLDTIYPNVSEIPVVESNMNRSADDFFDFGKLDLKENIKQELKAKVDSMNSAGMRITNVRVISGTDMVRVTGDLIKAGIHNNQELATARANVIKDYLATLGVDITLVNICTYPNNIENKPGYQPNESLRIAGVTIESFKLPNTPPNDFKTVKTTTADFELVRVRTGGGDYSQGSKIGTSGNQKGVKTGTKSKKAIIDVSKCPLFGTDDSFIPR